ncbi:hypothetical protein BJX76DRAFT_344483 [Aspergillus varians]
MREYRTPAMFWFLNKGKTIEEHKPIPLNFIQDFPVKDGNPKMLYIDVWANAEDDEAPVHKNSGTKNLVSLKGNLSVIPQTDLVKTIHRRADGNEYYCFEGVIEATYSSAETRYVLSVMGKKYDSVTAEYAY